MITSPVRVGLIGVTGFGSVHYEMCCEAHEKGEISLDACVIINPEDVPDAVAKLESMGCEVLSSADALFSKYKDRLDLVCIPTGISTHASFTIQALEMGASVFVEKPAAGTVEEVDAMIAAERENRGCVAVGFQDVFRRDLQELKKELVGGRYGRVEQVSVLGCWPRPESYYARNNWAGRVRVDGRTINDSPANNALAHYVNMALFLAGTNFESSARIVETRADLRRANCIESFDTVSSVSTLVEGGSLHLGLSHACDDEANPTAITLTTDRFRIVLDFMGRETRVESLNGELVEVLASDYESARGFIMGDLIRCVRGEPQFICGLEIARSHTELVESLHASGAVVDFDPSEIEAKEWNGSELKYVPGMSKKLSSLASQNALLRDL